ncbi:hypothetical protein [Micromonospora pisi]|nr:hypothetical protein [Micromonospora pisi]
MTTSPRPDRRLPGPYPDRRLPELPTIRPSNRPTDHRRDGADPSGAS